MDISKIKEIINKGVKENSDFRLSETVEVQKKANLTLEIDRNLQKYYYQITNDDLEKSSLTEQDVQKMIEMGWKINDNEKTFFKNI